MKETDDSIMVQIFAGSPLEAKMLQNLLEDNDIHSYLKDEFMGSIAPFSITSGGVDPVKVMISSLDVDKAEPILKKFEEDHLEA